MRMLSQPVYNLYLTFPTGDFRILENHECPLMVQLNWVKDNSDGRFLVQNVGDKYSIAKMRADIYGVDDTPIKKSVKKSVKKNKSTKKGEKGGDIANDLFNEVQESPFLRTISNPDHVMKIQRKQKTEKAQSRLAAESKDIQVFTDLSPNLYFVTVRVSTSDNVDQVVKHALNELNIQDEPENYLIAKVITVFIFKLQPTLFIIILFISICIYILHTFVTKIVENFY